MLTVATLFWQTNEQTSHFSDGYTVEWVERLYRGFARNLTVPFRFVVFTDRIREYGEPIEQELLANRESPQYLDVLEPFRLNDPMILVGLDTVVTGNCDELAEYCLTADRVALPRDAYKPSVACNGVMLAPAGCAEVWHGADREKLNPRYADMQRLRELPHNFLDDLFPGACVSYKRDVQGRGLGNAKIVFFHGDKKPHQIGDVWLADHWR